MLDKAREIRNRVQDLFGFSEQDYALFRAAYIITNQLWTSTMIEQEDISILLKSGAKKSPNNGIQSFINQLYHNFIRPHMVFGKTPLKCLG